MDIPTKDRKILVTQALPYANAPLHLGHILEAVQTDIWTRFQNLNKNECYFFCADDTHGTPVMLKAKELGITPENLIEDVYQDHLDTYKKYNINFTNFHSTHSDECERHAPRCHARGRCGCRWRRQKSASICKHGLQIEKDCTQSAHDPTTTRDSKQPRQKN